MSTSNEAQRLAALRRLNVLGTPSSEGFDRIVRMAAQLFGAPIAAISLSDETRQWFKASVGLDADEMPRATAPCTFVTETAAALIVTDVAADPRYAESLLARSGVKFYAAAPIVTRDGFCIGALFAAAHEAREVNAQQMTTLLDLAVMVMAQIELERTHGRIDAISGLPNRSQFIDDLDALAAVSPAAERRLAVLIDVAKSDQLSRAIRVVGAAYVDELMAQAAEAIGALIEPGQRAYHVATTQFAFLAPAGVDEAAYVAMLEYRLGDIHAKAAARFLTTPTIGVAPFLLGQLQARDILRIAHSAAEDAASVESKVSVYSPAQDSAHRRRFLLLNDFGAALAAPDQLRLVFQPKIALASTACVGAEALLRWTHPVMGEISPGEFIPLVERTALARETTAWVLEAALKQLAAWRDAGIDLALSVNISAANLEETDFADRLADGLGRWRVPADRLELEVTESAIMEDSGRALAQLEAIHALGVTLSIDDFGTGYSSLAYLQRLPCQVVKIDRSFMRDLAVDPRRRKLVAAMIGLSHDLGYKVVGEGIETADVAHILTEAGCDDAQGYFFGRPMTPRDFAAWLKQSGDKDAVAA